MNIKNIKKTISAGGIVLNDKNDIVEAKWFEKKQAIEILTHRKDKEVLKNYQL